ncbi:hypothetical protein Tco_0392971, partial [Tanacetum coccineum]
GFEIAGIIGQTKDIYSGKYLSMVESLKATDKDYRKLLVIDEMLEYVFSKYRNKWHLEDDIVDVILDDLWMKYGKDDKGKGKVLDLENRVENIEVDFARAIKAKEAKEAKQAEHDQLKVNSDEDVFSNEGVFGDEDLVLFNDVKYPLTDAEIMMFKERHKRSRAPTRQVTFTSTSNAQAASTSAIRGYKKIAMTGCVLALRSPNDPNASTLAPRERKSKKP